MSKNFVSYNDIETIIEKIKLELDKKAVVVAITQEDYDALTEEEQNNGTIYFIIDYNEISGGGITTNFVIKGYYNSEDGKFYNEPSFSTETAKSANYLYIDLAENIIYIYDSTTEEFSALDGNQGDGITKISMNGEELTVTDGEVDLGTVLTEHQDISGKQDKSTAVKYDGISAVGSATKGVYVDANGNATAMTYELNKTVPANAKFTDTTYSNATTSADGLLSKEDKTKLDGLSINNGTLTIQKNGTNVQTFTANQSGNATANITVPTKVSELTNDSGFTSNAGTVTSVKVGTTSYSPSNGVVNLPAYPTGGSFNISDIGVPITIGKWVTGFDLKLVVYRNISSKTTIKIYNNAGSDVTSSGAIPAGGKVVTSINNILSGMTPVLVTGIIDIPGHDYVPMPNKYVDFEFYPAYFTIYNNSSEDIPLSNGGATIFVWYW